MNYLLFIKKGSIFEYVCQVTITLFRNTLSKSVTPFIGSHELHGSYQEQFPAYRFDPINSRHDYFLHFDEDSNLPV